MSTTAIVIDLPEELVNLLGPADALPNRVREALVLDLLRHAEISQGRAAQLLGITRWEILDLMARDHIESGPESAEEMQEEIETVRRLVRLAPVHDRG